MYGHFKQKIVKNVTKMTLRVKFDIKFEFVGRTIGQQEKI